MNTKIRTLLKIGLTITMVVVFALYGISRSQGFLKGPQIAISSPINGTISSNSAVKITGRAKNISLLYLNGRKIFTNEDGLFEESLLLAHGYNIIEIKAQDKFNREIREIRRIVYK